MYWLCISQQMEELFQCSSPLFLCLPSMSASGHACHYMVILALCDPKKAHRLEMQNNASGSYVVAADLLLLVISIHHHALMKVSKENGKHRSTYAYAWKPLHPCAIGTEYKKNENGTEIVQESSTGSAHTPEWSCDKDGMWTNLCCICWRQVQLDESIYVWWIESENFGHSEIISVFE